MRSWLRLHRPDEDVVLEGVCPAGRYNLVTLEWAHLYRKQSGSKGANCFSLLSLVSGACSLLCDTQGYTAEMATQLFKRGDVA